MEFKPANYEKGTFANYPDAEKLLEKSKNFLEDWKDRDESYFDKMGLDAKEKNEIMVAGGYAMAIVMDNEAKVKEMKEVEKAPLPVPDEATEAPIIPPDEEVKETSLSPEEEFEQWEKRQIYQIVACGAILISVVILSILL